MELSEIQNSPEKALQLIQELTGQVEKQNTHIDQLQEELKLALLRKFGRSSEKLDPSQLDFFETTEDEKESAEEEEKITVPSHTRKKSGRKPLDASIPREVILHDIPEDEKICGCGHKLIKIEDVITERLQIIPEKLYVEQHVRPKYACRHCEGSGDEDKPVFRIAPAPPSILPGSIVTSGLLAFILTNKFCDHLPFYRQEKRFERIGAHISRQDMSNWVMRAFEVLKILEELFRQKIKEGPVIQMDETPVQVMKELDKPDTAKSYMWLARGGPPESPLVIYKYQKTRSSQHAKDFLEGFSGFLQTDGYIGYEAALKDNTDITHVGCLAHARRKFVDATKVGKKSGSAHIAVRMIRDIYRKEAELKELNLTGSELVDKRKKQVSPLLKEFKEWLDDKAVKIRPSSKTGQAVKYTLGQWEKIIRYIYSPYLTPDNNGAERAVKPFVMGRKNWLFSGSPRGAKASCFFYSLIETAKENDLNPYGYLKWIFDQAALMVDDIDGEKLLPWNVDRDEITKMAFKGL